MTMVVVSLSYHTASLADLERICLGTNDATEALGRLATMPGVAEAAMLATCHRVEAYLWVSDRNVAGTAAAARGLLEEQLVLPPGWLVPRSQILIGAHAVRHLFVVAAGLDSLVLGESQIQGQVRDAYRLAATQGAIGPNLHAIFRSALRAGKRVRGVASLDRVRRALPEAGVRAIAKALGGGLTGAHVLVVGAGDMAAVAVECLVARGASVRVAARRIDAARELAASRGAHVARFEAIDDALELVDAAIFASAAPSVLLTHERGELAVSHRDDRRLVLLDLCMPRNIDPLVAGLSGVELFDLERLHRDGFTGDTGWEEELARARAISLGAAEECLAGLESKTADGLSAAIQALGSRITATETERVFRRLPDLDPHVRDAITAAVTRAVRAALQTPLVRTKDAMARGDDAAVDIARWLFGLDGEQQRGRSPLGRSEVAR